MTDSRAITGFVDLGDIRFELYGSLGVTLRHVKNRSLAAVYRAAEALGPGHTHSYADALEAVKQAVSLRWYEDQGKTPPATLRRRAENRQRVEKMRKEERPKPEDEPNAADVIREGVRKGKTHEQILQDVYRRCPSSNADRTHVNYYRHRLRKDGEDFPEAGTWEPDQEEEAA